MIAVSVGEADMRGEIVIHVRALSIVTKPDTIDKIDHVARTEEGTTCLTKDLETEKEEEEVSAPVCLLKT